MTTTELVTPSSPPPPAAAETIEVSIVMPCLNEADTVATCVEKALRALRENNIAGEVIVADNGSTDGSQDLARGLGARVVSVEAKGYGNALMGGIAAARGKYIIMGDADDSYDFLEVPKFVEKLRQGCDLVQGCRLPSGGGRIMPGAMPPSHRWLGNPLFSLMVQHMFWSPIHDVYCGMRGFTKELYQRLDQRCTGMEFATEMIIKAGFCGAQIGEVPITLHPDGRKTHPPHLRTLRDGWRTLRFFLMYCPRWLFWYPGIALILLGLVGYGLALPGVTVHGIAFDLHTLAFSSLVILVGYQSVLFAIFTKVFGIGEGLLPEDPRLTRLFRVATLEKGLLLGASMILVGAVLLLRQSDKWHGLAVVLSLIRLWQPDPSPPDYEATLRWVLTGVTLTALGFQTVLSSFFISILGLRRR